MKTNSGWQTLLLITSVQLALLLTGILVLFSWFSTRNEEIAETQAYMDNTRISQQVADKISDLGIVSNSKIDEAKQLQIQQVLEKYNVPNGFLSLVEPATGDVVSSFPKSYEFVNKTRFDKVRFGGSERNRLLETSQYAKGETTSLGEVNFGGKTHYANATYLSEAGAVLVVARQPCQLLAATGEEIDSARNIFFSWTLVGGLVFLCTSLLVLNWIATKVDFISRRFQRKIAEREMRIEKIQDAVIFGLAKLAESRDNDTGEHLDRIRSYVTILAKDLRTHFEELQSDSQVQVLSLASSLHDIGKVGIPDAILLKPGRLSQAERDVMELHASIGGECLEAIQKHLGDENLLLSVAQQIAFYHHERWDGSGYPHQLAAEKIPLAARIVAVADVYDALTSKRPYKEPFSHLESRGIILSGSGSQFDPEVVAAFLRNEDEFEAISKRQQTLSVKDVRSDFLQLCERAQEASKEDLVGTVSGDQG